MPRRQARSNFARGGRAISPSWSHIQNVNRVTVPASSKLLLAFFTANVAGLEETVLRTRARVFVGSDQGAAVEEQLGAFGIIVVTELARIAGVASIPGPATDGGNDGWFVHQMIVQTSAATTASPTGWFYDIDSKAMRKVPEGYNLAVVVENIGDTNPMIVDFGVRILSKVTQG